MLAEGYFEPQPGSFLGTRSEGRAAGFPAARWASTGASEAVAEAAERIYQVWVEHRHTPDSSERLQHFGLVNSSMSRDQLFLLQQNELQCRHSVVE